MSWPFFWLGVYVFINLTAILWLGSLALNTVTGIDLVWGLVGLGAFAMAYSLYGGLKAVALTDIIQVTLLVLGGLFIAGIALYEVSGGEGMLAGFGILLEKLPEKFDLIFTSDQPYYDDLPGISVLLAPDLELQDQAYPTVMKLLPTGILGLVFAALIAAIVSSLASMMNSISTIFTMDFYRHVVRQEKTEQQLVKVGRLVSFIAMIIAMIIAKPLLGQFTGAFRYIQEFTGFFTPGVCALFLMGIFWKRTTANGALGIAIGSAIFSVGFKFLWPSLPFIDRVGWVFVLCILTGIVISLVQGAEEHPDAIKYEDVNTATTSGFNWAALGIVLMLTFLYVTWW